MFDRKKWTKRWRTLKIDGGMCSKCCIRKREIGYAECKKCRNCRKLRRKKAKNNKYCIVCTIRPAIKGKTNCEKCGKLSIESKKEKYHWAIKNHLCVDCYDKLDINYKKRICKVCTWKRLLRRHNLTDEQATKMLEKQDYICPLSGRKLEKGVNASVDHIIPIKGGRNVKKHKLNRLMNLQFVDVDINLCKQDYSIYEFKQICEEVAKWSNH